jgi:hypothetical protein
MLGSWPDSGSRAVLKIVRERSFSPVETGVVTFLPPLRGLLTSHLPPTACAVGYILSPLRG